MAKAQEEAQAVEEKMVEEGEQNPLVAMLRKLMLAGIGAVAMTQEEMEKLVDKMVDRGEIAEKDARQLVQETMERRKKEAKKAEEELDKRLEEVMARMNVPSKGDIDALSAKITELSKKVDELKEA